MTVYSRENQNAGLIHMYLNTGWWIPLTHNAKIRLQVFFRAINHRHLPTKQLHRARISETEMAEMQKLARSKGFTIELRERRVNTTVTGPTPKRRKTDK